MEGIVKSFSRNRGFGFITTQAGKDIFVHHTDIAEEDRDYLVEGQRVRFDVREDERGQRAVKVRVTAEVSLAKERRLDWRGHRHGRPSTGELPKTVQERRGIAPEEDEEEEEEEE
ncbi:MAG TPA: cold shock domain-containing protein [Armatimonadota bacterium]|nr:cold shock domain-containing protein [Armatimonadota bacterium]